MPVLICSDYQADICLLDGYLVRSRQVLRCRGLLGELERAYLDELLKKWLGKMTLKR